jgi:hypothetical protein
MEVGRYGDLNAAVLPSATLGGLRATSKLVVEDRSGSFGRGRDRVVVTASSKNRAEASDG